MSIIGKFDANGTFYYYSEEAIPGSAPVEVYICYSPFKPPAFDSSALFSAVD